MFQDVPNKVNFPELEEEVLQRWEDKDIFHRSIKQREGSADWVFYDGPPGTNGLPHVGHMMQSALKDLFGRYKTMRGFRVLRKAGWDTHGLPVELTAERELKLKSKRDIEAYGVNEYIDYCRRTVFRYKKEWEESIRRVGRFIDLEDAYATLTTDYIQSDWWTIKSIWAPSDEMRRILGLNEDEKLLYKDFRISPYCPRCGTSLSNFEVAQGYKDTVDFALFPKFKDADEDDLYYIAWTTTAWTLLSNVALAVGPNIDYVFIKKNGERWLLAEARLEALAEHLGDYEIIGRIKGNELAGRRYIPLWDFLNHPGTTAHQVIADEYVTTEDGTGIVHLAAYGEDDYRLIRAYNLPVIQNVDEHGECHGGIFSGRYFRDPDLDVDIIKDLAAQGLLFHKEKHAHSYPFCFRCNEALMYFLRGSWFIRTSRIKDRLLEANLKISWYPDHIKKGRFGNWLENNVDWNISRERYWGSPLPVWTCEACGSHKVMGSLKELGEEYYNSHDEHLPADFDPHKPYIDQVPLKCNCGGMMQRENFMLDSWFNAGIMPWGQFGYPSAPGSIEIFDNQFPGDFICEAIDQTRGWFYTMLAAAVLVKGESSYKNVICTELILDDKGQKMSKSKGNVIHPMEVMKKFGADPFRWVFFNSNPWTVKYFSEDVIVESLRKVIIPLWNAYSFFVTYANVDGWKPAQDTAPKSPNLLDRWIISEFQALLKIVTDHLDSYDVAPAGNAVEDFIDKLTNWYIRRSRRRFWKSENDSDKQQAYSTLYYILLRFSRLLAPFLPFLSEHLYRNLASALPDSKDSVHLEDFPVSQPELRDEALERLMSVTLEAVTLGRSLRNDYKIKIRQPLPELKIIGSSEEVSETGDIIAEELNVKRITFADEEDGLIRLNLKPDFRKLGPRFGKRMKEAQQAIQSLSHDDIERFCRDKKITILGEELCEDDLLIEESAGEGLGFKRGSNVSVILDMNLTEKLIDEGYAREFVNKVQNLRKDTGLTVTDRIDISYLCDDRLALALQTQIDFIKREVLGINLERKDNLPATEVKINDRKAIIIIEVNNEFRS